MSTMSSFNNNFAGMNFGYTFGDEQLPDFGASSNVFDSDAPIIRSNRSQDWYLNPSTDGYSNRGYQESTLLGVSGGLFVDPYSSQTMSTYGDYTGESHSFWSRSLGLTLKIA